MTRLILVAAATSWSLAFAQTAPPAVNTPVFAVSASAPLLHKPRLSETFIRPATVNPGVDFNAKVMTVVVYGNELRFTGERDKSVPGEDVYSERWSGQCKQQDSDYFGVLTILRHKRTGEISAAIDFTSAQGYKQFSTSLESSDAGKRTIVVETRHGSSKEVLSTPLPKCGV
jgi:hypothetical protein